LTRPWL